MNCALFERLLALGVHGGAVAHHVVVAALGLYYLNTTPVGVPALAVDEQVDDGATQ